MLKEVFLNIADFIICLRSKSEAPLFIENGYKNFLVEKPFENIDINIEVFDHIPNEILKSEKKKIYSAVMDDKALWEISEAENELRFDIFQQKSSTEIQQIAFCDKSYGNWKIFTSSFENEDGNIGICPLLYPMGPLIMYYLTVKNDAIMIHASGVFDGEKGRIFSGFSGVGKSTMGNIWQTEGSELINDDRLIIRKKKDGFYFYNTPMFYEDKPKKAKLDEIYLPYHHPENILESLNGIKAVASLMSYCIQHGYDKSIISHHLNVISQICAAVPVSKLGFVPNKSVISFLKAKL